MRSVLTPNMFLHLPANQCFTEQRNGPTEETVLASGLTKLFILLLEPLEGADCSVKIDCEVLTLST